MRPLRLLAAVAAAGLLYSWLRRPEEPAASSAAPAGLAEPPAGEDAEPVLGYDGMDLQTVIPWLESANLDRPTLERIHAYELRHEARETVLRTLDDLRES